ncbi:type II toxin-antitoxin system VapC family toxin [Salinisphaera sp.]|uniref:type II toxin-antitoxin system VapC family toxin n=1 Tax=Salinisphaera sp. TaxID=1914330 RepID=UPI002D7768A4|nr:type II toxin-antitoxin system VapC family toxin [Salinisphaera sp.]HET7313798.1 type II toxin-antitoxin system VapC family toxin [Salinisphaera sp.]
MIVLDTNVLSELLRPVPEAEVVTWVAKQPRPALFTTTVSRGEILYGLRLLADGQRRQRLWAAALAIFDEDLAGRTLSFDNAAADTYAEIAAVRRESGRPISQFDAMIASVTYSRGASLATRNVRDFEGCGIDVINPWEE